MAHRVVPMDSTVLVSQLHTFTLTQLTYNNTVAGKWLPAESVSDDTVYTEAYYGAFALESV
jgi:virginiamycin B lyase